MGYRSFMRSWMDATPEQEQAMIRYFEHQRQQTDPVMCLKAIVSRVGSDEDGSIIRVLAPAWNRIAELVRKDPDELFQLSPTQWEELVAASYDKAGFDEVILTPRSGDFGRDVIATKHGWGTVRIIDQVKAYKAGHVVTANDVRALLGVLHGDPKATKAVMTTTSSFAPKILEDPYISPFCPYRLELVDGEQLFSRLKDLSE